MLKISKKDLLNIKILLEERALNYGKFSNKNIVNKLELNGSIICERKSAQRRILHLTKEQNVYLFLKDNNYNIKNIEDFDIYFKEILEKIPSRDIVQKWHNSTKIKESESLKGLYISSLNNLDIKINDESVTIVPTNGIGYFCFYTEKITLSKNTIIVGVKNYQVTDVTIIKNQNFIKMLEYQATINSPTFE